MSASCWSCYLTYALAAISAISFLSILLPIFWAKLSHWNQSLKKRYNATWAVVTGGTSGIGLSLCKQLAADGLNVVVVGLPGEVLDQAMAELTKAFPAIQFRAVGVILGKGDYLSKVAAATADIDVTLVFSNAGYMVTGFFESCAWEKHEANINCNSTAAVAIAHLFLCRMRAKGLKGAITFTSSPAGFMPSPFSCLYGATKAFLTQFATSLAGEVYKDGIDVCVLHPSPVATSFYAGAHHMSTLNQFKATAVGPDGVARALINGIGRSVIVDHGYYPPLLRLLFRLIDGGFMAEIVARVSHTVKDYKELKEQHAKEKAKAQ